MSFAEFETRLWFVCAWFSIETHGFTHFIGMSFLNLFHFFDFWDKHNFAYLNRFTCFIRNIKSVWRFYISKNTMAFPSNDHTKSIS